MGVSVARPWQGEALKPVRSANAADCFRKCRCAIAAGVLQIWNKTGLPPKPKRQLGSVGKGRAAERESLGALLQGERAKLARTRAARRNACSFRQGERRG